MNDGYDTIAQRRDVPPGSTRRVAVRGVAVLRANVDGCGYGDDAILLRVAG
jgi:hypothetical protein